MESSTPASMSNMPIGGDLVCPDKDPETVEVEARHDDNAHDEPFQGCCNHVLLVTFGCCMHTSRHQYTRQEVAVTQNAVC